MCMSLPLFSLPCNYKLWKTVIHVNSWKQHCDNNYGVHLLSTSTQVIESAIWNRSSCSIRLAWSCIHYQRRHIEGTNSRMLQSRPNFIIDWIALIIFEITIIIRFIWFLIIHFIIQRKPKLFSCKSNLILHLQLFCRLFSYCLSSLRLWVSTVTSMFGWFWLCGRTSSSGNRWKFLGTLAANQETILSLITCWPSSEVMGGPFKLICIREFSMSPFKRLCSRFLINFTLDAPLLGQAFDIGMTRRASTTEIVRGEMSQVRKLLL